jgi:hypothetical protein
LIEAYIAFVQHTTFTEKLEAELIQISAKANEEALFEVLTQYTLTSIGMPSLKLKFKLSGLSLQTTNLQACLSPNQKISRTQVLHAITYKGSLLSAM